MVLDANYVTNIMGSFELFLYNNIVLPYNTAVTGTAYPAPLRIILNDPDDYSVVEQVPVLIMDYPVDIKPPLSVGVGDSQMWSYPYFTVQVYPALWLDSVSSSDKPARASANLLRSLFASVTARLTIPLYDLAVNNTTEVDFAYIDAAKVSDTKGPMRDLLAMEKFRFNADFRLRLMIDASV